jgi:agmatinase
MHFLSSYTTMQPEGTAKREVDLMTRKPLLVGERATLLASGFPSFIRAPWIRCEISTIREHAATAAFLGMPFDQASVYRTGGNLGPKALRAASDQFLPYLGDFDIDLFEHYHLVDCGDVPIIPGNAERSRGNVREYVGRILDAGAVAICCGGDHSLPEPIGQAIHARTPNFGYLHLDAHIDAAAEFSGELHTNWSGVARIADLIDPHKIAVVGVRGAANPPEQFDWSERVGLNLYRMTDILRRGIDSVMEDALEHVTKGTDTLYVSWDMDVIDCSHAPGANGNEPGGLTSREALRAAELIGLRKPQVFEIAELVPTYDPTFITAKIACYLIFNVLGAAATGKERL